MQRQDDEGDRPIPWRSRFVYRERRRRVGRGDDAERTSPIEPLCGLFIVGEEANAEEGAGRRAVGDVHTGQRTQRHVSESEPPKSMKNKTK